MTGPRTYLCGRVTVHHGDSRDVLKGMADASVDSVVCDPPYALVSIVKRFGSKTAAPTKDGDVYSRSSAGFMGQAWDTGETAFAAEFWAEVLRVLKPAVAANVLAHGTGALNIEASANRRYSDRGATNFAPTPGPRGGDARGRWPANVIHDGSEEVLAAFPDSDGQQGDVRGDEPSSLTNNCYGKFNGRPATVARGDRGSAARFFYSSKADSDDRIGSTHPTVKPVDLMRYLCRLVTPPGGMVLDPFAGTGTTGEAAWLEGFRATLIEREAQYITDIERRMRLCLAGPEEKARAIIKAKGKVEAPGPLFAEAAE